MTQGISNERAPVLAGARFLFPKGPSPYAPPKPSPFPMIATRPGLFPQTLPAFPIGGCVNMMRVRPFARLPTFLLPVPSPGALVLQSTCLPPPFRLPTASPLTRQRHPLLATDTSADAHHELLFNEEAILIFTLPFCHVWLMLWPIVATSTLCRKPIPKSQRLPKANRGRMGIGGHGRIKRSEPWHGKRNPPRRGHVTVRNDDHNAKTVLPTVTETTMPKPRGSTHRASGGLPSRLPEAGVKTRRV